MSTHLSQAQSAQQGNRTIDGKYTFGTHAEPEGLNLASIPTSSVTAMRNLLVQKARLVEPSQVDFEFDSPLDFEPLDAPQITESVAETFAFDLAQLGEEPDELLLSEAHTLAEKWEKWAGDRATMKACAMGYHAAELRSMISRSEGQSPARTQTQLHQDIMNNPGDEELLQRSATMSVFYEIQSGRHRPLSEAEDAILRSELARDGSLQAIVGRALYESQNQKEQFGIKLAQRLIEQGQQRERREASFVPSVKDTHAWLVDAFDESMDIDDYRIRLEEGLPLLAGSQIIDDAVQSRLTESEQWSRRRLEGLSSYHHKLDVLRVERPEVAVDENANFRTQPVCEIEVEIDQRILDGTIDETDYEQMVDLNGRYDCVYDTTNIRNLVRHRIQSLRAWCKSKVSPTAL